MHAAQSISIAQNHQTQGTWQGPLCAGRRETWPVGIISKVPHCDSMLTVLKKQRQWPYLHSENQGQLPSSLRPCGKTDPFLHGQEAKEGSSFFLGSFIADGG